MSAEEIVKRVRTLTPYDLNEGTSYSPEYAINYDDLCEALKDSEPARDPIIAAFTEHKALVIQVLHDFERAALAGTLVETTSYTGYAAYLLAALKGEQF